MSKELFSLAEKIKLLRETTGMTQAELARILGISRSGVNAWEMGLSIPSWNLQRNSTFLRIIFWVWTIPRQFLLKVFLKSRFLLFLILYNASKIQILIKNSILEKPYI